MPTSQHLAVRDAVAALLQAAPSLVNVRVFENRDYRLPAEQAVGIWVFRESSEPARGAIYGAPIDWATRLRVVVKARSTPQAATAEVAADTVATAAYAAVMANQQLGGLASDLEAGPITWLQEEAETNVAVCEMEFTAQHRTTSNTLE